MKSKIKSSEIEKINNLLIESLECESNDKYIENLKKTFYFKGRKSVALSSFIIEKLLSLDEKVLDPFVGGGSFVLSSLISDRKITGIELDNYTFFALNIIFSDFNIDKLNEFFNDIKTNCENKILSLYETKCCNNTNYIKKLFFDPINREYFEPTPHREINDGMNVHLLNKCTSCLKSKKKFDKEDYNKLLDLEAKDTSSFPSYKLMENSRINITASKGSDNYKDFFNKRAQFSLLTIQKYISLLEDCIEKDILQHILVNTLPLSKITMYGSSTDILYHRIHNRGQETNVWYLYESKYDSFIKFKTENSSILERATTKLKLIHDDYKHFLDDNKDKYDLIYTDFPYTDQVPYIERNQLYRLWLQKFVDEQKFSLSDFMLDNEIVQTNAVKRTEKSSIESYYKDLDIMFLKLYNALNDNKYMFITIKLGNKKHIQTYAEIINLARKNGFEYITKIGIDSTNPTLRKQSAYANTLQKNQIVVFKKLPENLKYFYIQKNNLEPTIIALVYKKIVSSNEYVTLTNVILEISSYILSKLEHIVTGDDINKIKQIINNNFIIEENQILKLNNGIFYTEAEDEKTIFMKLYDTIPICIKELFTNKCFFEIEDLYLKLTSILCETSHSLLSKILDNSEYSKEIKKLINVYCEIENGVYVKKKYKNTYFEGSKDISQFTGSEFELLIKNLLEKEGFTDICIRGGACDRGVDIIATKIIEEKNKIYYFQCKRWAANVGSEPIQRLYAEKTHNKIDHAICVTTSDFTNEGKKVVENYEVEIWNGIKVMNLLNQHFPKKYFNALLPS